MDERYGVREKTFEEELYYYWERVAEVLDSYVNSGGGEDPLYICVLRDSKRIMSKAREEVNRSIRVIEDKNCYIDYLEERVKDKKIKEIENKGIDMFSRKLKVTFKKETSPLVYPYLEEIIDNLVKEMTKQSVNYGSSKTERK